MKSTRLLVHKFIVKAPIDQTYKVMLPKPTGICTLNQQVNGTPTRNRYVQRTIKVLERQTRQGARISNQQVNLYNQCKIPRLEAVNVKA
jgi:hypothetical protein